MKPKVYESFAEQKIDQRIGLVAFLIVNIVVGVALLKPAEFVVIKIAQLAGQTS